MENRKTLLLFIFDTKWQVFASREYNIMICRKFLLLLLNKREKINLTYTFNRTIHILSLFEKRCQLWNIFSSISQKFQNGKTAFEKGNTCVPIMALVKSWKKNKDKCYDPIAKIGPNVVINSVIKLESS